MRYIAGLFAVSSFALLVFGFPAPVDAAICAFTDADSVIYCNDNSDMDDSGCTALYTTVSDGSSYQSDGNAKVFDGTIATCEEYEASLAPPPTAPSSPSASGGTVGDIDVSAITGSLTQLNKLSANSIPDLIGRGLRLFTGFFGSIALIMVIYGGLQIMTAAGQSEKIKQGGKIIAWASIGLITMMLSYLLVDFVFGVVT